MMILLYKQFIESVLYFCIIAAWYGTLSLSNKNRLSSLVKVEDHWYWSDLSFLHFSYVFKNAQVIIHNVDHPLQTEFQVLPSGC